MVRYVIKENTRRRCTSSELEDTNNDIDIKINGNKQYGISPQRSATTTTSLAHTSLFPCRNNPTSTSQKSCTTVSAMQSNVEDPESFVPPPTTPIDLLRGHPSTYLLATAPFLSATNVLLGNPSSLPQNSYDPIRHPLAYGPNPGNSDIRKEILDWQEELYGKAGGVEIDLSPSPSPSPSGTAVSSRRNSSKITPDEESSRKQERKSGPNPANRMGLGDSDREARINLTCGASYGLFNALVQCTSPVTGYTRRAFIVAPAYFLACPVFIDAGFTGKLTPVLYPPPEGETLPDLLLAELKADKERQPNPHVPLEEGLRPIGGEKGSGPRSGKRIYKYVLYCVPTFGNPTGTTWDFETRRRVVDIAREWDILVICDDVYDFLGWRTTSPPLPPPPRLVTLDRQLVLTHASTRDPSLPPDAGNVISNCSFSKLLGPGLRCGWQESATDVLAKQLADGGANHSGGTPGHLVSCVVMELLKPVEDHDDANEGGDIGEEGGNMERGRRKERGGEGRKRRKRKINEIIDNVAKVLGQRAEKFVEACYRYLPEGSEVLGFPPPTGATGESGSTAAAPTTGGGYFLWVGLGPSETATIDASEVIKLASQGERLPSNTEEGGDVTPTYINRLVAASGSISECPGSQLGFGKRWVRIAVSWCGAAEGIEGIRRLGAACKRWQEGERV